MRWEESELTFKDWRVGWGEGWRITRMLSLLIYGVVWAIQQLGFLILWLPQSTGVGGELAAGNSTLRPTGWSWKFSCKGKKKRGGTQMTNTDLYQQLLNIPFQALQTFFPTWYIQDDSYKKKGQKNSITVQLYSASCCGKIGTWLYDTHQGQSDCCDKYSSCSPIPWSLTTSAFNFIDLDTQERSRESKTTLTKVGQSLTPTAGIRKWTLSVSLNGKCCKLTSPSTNACNF